jgi:hypothetical protein
VIKHSAPLADFGLHMGRRSDPASPARDPDPLGHFKSLYVKVGDYMAHVRLHDLNMGVMTDLVPDEAMRQVYELEYALVRGIIEDRPTALPQGP